MAARYIIRDNTDKYRLDQNPLLLMLDCEDFQRFLKCAQRFVQVALLLVSGVVVGGGERAVLWVRLLQRRLLYLR